MLLLALCSPSHAEDEKYLLGDIGVRIDLPATWTALEWADWYFKGETTDHSIRLFAWATPFQDAPSQQSAEAWKAHFPDKFEDWVGKVSKLKTKNLEVVSGEHGPTLRSTWTFELAKGSPGLTVFTASLPVEGQVFHIATLTASRQASKTARKFSGLLKRLEVRKKALQPEAKPSVDASGITTQLPKGWRAPAHNERKALNQRIATFGITAGPDCWQALRPRGLAAPDIMVSCQGGMWLGVVDERSFQDKEVDLRNRLFGDAGAAPPGEELQLSDRLGFIHHPDIGANQLFMATVPYDKGLARTWIGSSEAKGAALKADLLTALQATQYSGPHPAAAVEKAQYYLKYRTFHPFVLVPALLLLGFLLLVIRVVKNASTSSSFEPLDE